MSGQPPLQRPYVNRLAHLPRHCVVARILVGGKVQENTRVEKTSLNELSFRSRASGVRNAFASAKAQTTALTDAGLAGQLAVVGDVQSLNN